MERGPKDNGKAQSVPKAYAISTYAAPSTTASYDRTSNAQGYQQVAKVNTQDKQTGSYERHTAEEESSTGEMYHGRGHREYGVKDENKTNSTLKVGDKSDYTEYYKEERVRNVSYGGGSPNAGVDSRKSFIYGGGASRNAGGDSGKSIIYGGGGRRNAGGHSGKSIIYGGGGNNYSYDGGDYDNHNHNDNDNDCSSD